MKMIFLVDGDNNIGTGLQGIQLLTAEDSVLIFYGKGQSLASIQKLCANTQAKVQYLESVKGGKNSIDFQIITELGVLVGRGEADFAYVISQDKGYEAAIGALWSRYADTFREVALRPSIQSCLRASFLMRAGSREELAQALNRALEQLEVGQTARQQPTQKMGGREEKAATAVGLKSLIVKTAETVSRQVEQMKSELRGEYVAVSDFGTYLEKTSQEIEEDPTKITRYFKFAADIQADVDKVDADFSAYKTDVQGYIRQGIVDYDGVTPIIGIAIGQDIRTTQTGVETEQGVFDVIDKRSNMSVWTTEKLSFYIGGQEAAYFSNGKLTVAQIATNRITGAGGWDVSFTGGVKFKWIGG